MTNVIVKEYKVKLNNVDYLFRMDFRSLKEFTNRFDNALELFNGLLAGIDIYGTCVKILSCCIRTLDGEFVEMTHGELETLLSFDFKTMKLIDDVTVGLIDGVFAKNGGTAEKK